MVTINDVADHGCRLSSVNLNTLDIQNTQLSITV